MENRLQNIFSSVNDWLKFAEAKNAALFAASSTLIIAVLKEISILKWLELWLPYRIGIGIYVGLLITQLALSATICLYSFLPQIKHLPLAPQKEPKDTDNLLFYGDIAHYEPTYYLRCLYKQQGEHVISTMPLEVDYARQIVVNSRIALRKYHLFTAALWLLLSAFFAPILVVLFYIYVQRRQRKP